jgi:predicted O-methyltransferase YrrM
VRLVATLPLTFRSSRQLAREALLRGARQKPSEFAELLRLVRRMKPRVIVEIGAGEGGATYGLRLAAPGATVVSIDMDKTVATILGDSHAPATIAALRGVLQGRPIDVLFIDGDHSYEGVRADFEMYAPLVRSGGIVTFHDILPHPAYPGYGVDRYWQEITPTYPHREFVDPSVDWGWGQWGGIGIITMP